MCLVPDRAFKIEKMLDALLVRYRPYGDAFRGRRQQRSRQFLQIENHECLFFADLKAAGAQAIEQIRRLIVTIDLPFETSVQIGEIPDLAIDYRFCFLCRKARVNNAAPGGFIADCANDVGRFFQCHVGVSNRLPLGIETQ